MQTHKQTRYKLVARVDSGLETVKTRIWAKIEQRKLYAQRGLIQKTLNVWRNWHAFSSEVTVGRTPQADSGPDTGLDVAADFRARSGASDSSTSS